MAISYETKQLILKSFRSGVDVVSIARVIFSRREPGKKETDAIEDVLRNELKKVKT